MIEDIRTSFNITKQSIDGHKDYPKSSGIYAFSLSDKSNLGEFGIGGQIIYIGIAKHSLHDRDFNHHFKTGKTGSSTLRRSVGAILKSKLNFTAIPRGGVNDSKRFENYKFSEEQELTDWMISNLEIGYWTPQKTLSYQDLRDTEKQVTIALKPTLDLDNRTRRFNPLADKLQAVREICKKEAKSEIKC